MFHYDAMRQVFYHSNFLCDIATGSGNLHLILLVLPSIPKYTQNMEGLAVGPVSPINLAGTNFTMLPV